MRKSELGNDSKLTKEPNHTAYESQHAQHFGESIRSIKRISVMHEFRMRFIQRRSRNFVQFLGLLLLGAVSGR